MSTRQSHKENLLWFRYRENEKSNRRIGKEEQKMKLERKLGARKIKWVGGKLIFSTSLTSIVLLQLEFSSVFSRNSFSLNLLSSCYFLLVSFLHSTLASLALRWRAFLLWTCYRLPDYERGGWITWRKNQSILNPPLLSLLYSPRSSSWHKLSSEDRRVCGERPY